jgi:hypothetical protein
VPELSLQNRERNAFAGELDSVGMAELVRREPAPDTGVGGKPDAAAMIEVNSNPSIRLLEQSGRGDLILKIWQHTFSAMGLLIV